MEETNETRAESPEPNSGAAAVAVMPAPDADIAPAVEALILATGEPLSAGAVADLLDVERDRVDEAIARIKARYDATDHGITVVEIAGGIQFATKPEHAELIERMLKEIRKVRLSPAALETLAIIAYRQPVTRTEIETIRGVNVDGVMKTLLDRELIKIAGKKEEPGRPLVYGTTEGFLNHFGLASIKDLPPLSEFDEIARAKATGELEPAPDWDGISENQRAALDALAVAAERELGDLDARLKSLKPPKVVPLEEAKSEEKD